MTTITIREYRRANMRALLKQKGSHYLAEFINYETMEYNIFRTLSYNVALRRYYDFVYDIDFVESD